MALTALVIPLGSQFTKFNGEPSVSFEDESVYRALQPYFDKMLPDIDISPYDGGVVGGPTLFQFVDLLKHAHVEIELKPSKWIVQTISWTQGGKQYCREVVADKEEVLSVISKLIGLAGVAISKNHMLFFVGD